MKSHEDARHLTTDERAERRREIATAAMQGLLACPTASANMDMVVSDAVACADALLAELEKHHAVEADALLAAFEDPTKSNGANEVNESNGGE